MEGILRSVAVLGRDACFRHILARIDAVYLCLNSRMVVHSLLSKVFGKICKTRLFLWIFSAAKRFLLRRRLKSAKNHLPKGFRAKCKQFSCAEGEF